MKRFIRSGSGILFVLIVFLLLAVPAWAATPQAAAGANHTLAIKSDGTLWAWGMNDVGQLGIGNTTGPEVCSPFGTCSTSPLQVGTAWAYIAAGEKHTAAIKSDGTLWAWGINSYGQLGIGNTTLKSSPMQVGTDADWASVASGSRHTVAIKSDGTLWAWGTNGAGQLGIGNNTGPQTCTFSEPCSTSPVQVGAAANWVTVAGGADYTVAVKSDGTLWAWGRNTFGELGIGNTTDKSSPVQVGTDTDWMDVIAGTHTVAIKSDGTLWAWGFNNWGQLGIGNYTGPETCGGYACSKSPVQVGTATNWDFLAAGSFHTVSIKSVGSLWAWGINVNGELGIGNTIIKSSPVQVGSSTAWIFVGSRGSHNVAIKSDGTIWTWGKNITGQLGIGNNTGPETCSSLACSKSPVEVMALADAYTLTMDTEGGTGLGNVVSAPAGISCGDGMTPDDCTQDYADGTNIELTATESSGSYFDGWSGIAPEGCVGTYINPCTFSMIYNASTTATFTNGSAYTITATVNDSDMGTIDPSGSVPVDEGDDQTFTITPNAGYYIKKLIIDSTPEDAATSYAFTNVTDDHTIEAVFAVMNTIEAIVNPGDVDGDGKDDIAVLITSQVDGKYANIKNATSGSWIGNVYFGNDYTALALTTMPDMDGDGLMEFAFLGENKSTEAIVAHVVSADGSYIRGTWFDKNYDFREFTTIPDTNANGYDDHVYLGVHNTNGQLVAQIRDAYTGSYIRGIWFNKDYDVKGMAFSNTIAGNTPELSVLGVHKTNGWLVAQIYNAASGSSLGNLWFDKNYVPQPNGYVDLADADGDGTYELATLGIHNSTGAMTSQIYNATGGHVRTVFWDSSYSPVDMAVVPNIANSTAEELALLEEHKTNGSVQVQVKDALTGVFIKNVSIDSDYTPLGLVAVSDQNSDGKADIAVLGRHKTTGARRVFVKDIITGNTIINIDFPAY